MESIKNGYINSYGEKNLCSTGVELKEFFVENSCEKMFAFATSAMRSAKNKDELIKKFHQATNIPVSVLTGRDESYCDYLSLKYYCNEQHGMGVDLGGGSFQLIKYSEENLYSKSYPLGVLRLKQRFLSSLFATDEEEENIKNCIINEVSTDRLLPSDEKTLNIMGGTGSAVKKLAYYCGVTKDNKQSYFTLDEFDLIGQKINELGDKKEQFLRKQVFGREDTIMVGFVILKTLCNVLKVDGVNIMDSGVREGFILNKIKKM